MPIQIFHSATLFPSTQIYCVNAIGWKTFNNVNGAWALDVDNEVIADFNGFFSPLPPNFLYVCNWVLGFQLTAENPPVDGSFPGNPIRKKYGFYSLNRAGYIFDDDTVRYATQISKKSAFMFGNLQGSNTPGVIADLPSAVPSTRVFGFGLDFFAGSSPANLGLLDGASRASGTFTTGTEWNISIQYGLSVLLVSNDANVSYRGLIL